MRSALPRRRRCSRYVDAAFASSRTPPSGVSTMIHFPTPLIFPGILFNRRVICKSTLNACKLAVYSQLSSFLTHCSNHAAAQHCPNGIPYLRCSILKYTFALCDNTSGAIGSVPLFDADIVPPIRWRLLNVHQSLVFYVYRGSSFLSVPGPLPSSQRPAPQRCSLTCTSSRCYILNCHLSR